MNDYILVVDGVGSVQRLVSASVEDTGVKLLVCPDVLSAKRTLIQAIPCVIISSVTLADGDKGGLEFCSDLQAHSEFAKIPVVLVADKIIEGLATEARVRGAEILLQLSTNPSEVRTILSQMIPDVISVSVANEELGCVGIKGEDHAKIEVAQHLLAKVLHNFKTSDLMHVVDKEDIPKVLFEIMRSVCGVASIENKARLKSNENEGIELDLDRVFDLKPKT